MKKKSKWNGVTVLWKTVAVAIAALKAELALALPMLVPDSLNQHSAASLTSTNLAQSKTDAQRITDLLPKTFA